MAVRRVSRQMRLRLRYSFDLRPHMMTCRYMGAVFNEEDALCGTAPGGVTVDRYLLPVMRGKDYLYVTEVIRHYFLPESSLKGKAVDLDLLMERQERWIHYGTFSFGEALGEYFFGFGSLDLIDEKSGRIVRRDIKPGAIILNRTACTSPEMRRSILAHEWTHSYLGRYFFMLQMMCGSHRRSYMCKKLSEEETCRSPFDRMEIHANIMPRYLLIPENEGREARSRLIDFGFTEAGGILRSVNGSLAPAFLSPLPAREVYAVDEKDAVLEYVRNPRFRDILRTGRYLYVPESGCCCISGPPYIAYDFGGHPYLTSFAREHMGECCLVFREEYRGTAFRLVSEALKKSIGKGSKQVRYVGTGGKSPVTEEGLELRKKIEIAMRESRVYEISFNDMTVELMKKRRVSVSRLADLTGISEETIKHMRNRPDIQFSIRTVTAVCIALHLPPMISEQYRLDNMDRSNNQRNYEQDEQ